MYRIYSGRAQLLAAYHDRMLVILGPDDYEVWLDADVRRPEKP